MDRLQKVYKFKYGKTEFEFQPHHKFNFIVDGSGKGKTWLCKQMMLATDNDDFIVLNTSVLASINFKKEYNSVFVIDEVQLHPIAKKLTWAGFQDTPNIFLIISRDIPVELSVDYRAVYTFHSKDRKYWLERKYDDNILNEESNNKIKQLDKHR